MSVFRSALVALVMLLAATPLAAEPIHVVASIKPVHSLVSALMQGVAEPHLIVQGGGSPHSFSLKPSDASALEQADLVVWIGERMETFLGHAIEGLAGKAKIVSLSQVPGLTRLKLREGGAFDADEHDQHAEGRKEEGEHGEEINMHLWLDPFNAKAMIVAIERALLATDPKNAATYRQNAATLSEKLNALADEIMTTLKPLKDRPFIVFHDAYQNFEHRFGVAATGSIAVSPEQRPGARRLQEIRAKIKQLGATCVFSEPQFEPKLVKVAIEGTAARSGVLDPLGANLENGPELYFTLLRNMARSMSDCLMPSS